MAKKLWKLFDGEPYFINPRRQKNKKGGKTFMAKRRRVRRHTIRRKPMLMHNPRLFKLPSLRRRRRRRNPDIKSFSKKVAGVSMGALAPIVMSAVLPFNFGSKVANFIRDIVYGSIGYAITKLHKPLNQYSKYFLVGAVAGSVVNYSKDKILEIGFIKGLQASQAIPQAQEQAKTSFYYTDTESPLGFLENELTKKGLPPVLV